MLGALRLVAQRPIPIVGVNLGSRGFLVEVEPHELDDALDRLDTGDYTIEEHSAAVLTDGCDESIAFNDIALASVPGKGAALIGSTAYSYAAGGALVSSMLEAMIISAVAPISGISRPAVISAAEPIALALVEGSGQPALQLDGTIM